MFERLLSCVVFGGSLPWKTVLLKELEGPAGLTMLLGLSSCHVALLASVCGLLSAGRPSVFGVRKMEGEQSSHPQGLAFHGDGLWNGGFFLPRDP